VPSPLPLETVTIELHNHISYEDTRVLSVLGVVPANQLRFVWQLPEVVPIEWETKQLILKVYKSMTTTVNNDPANRFWPFFTVVCATPVISITQPARVNCGEVVTVSWTYLFPEKNLWKPTDQLTLEIYSYLPLGIDPVLQKLTDSIPYGETTFRYNVPATIPNAWPTPDGKNRVYFVVSKTGDRQQTSDRVCLLCPYPFLTCVASTSGAPAIDQSMQRSEKVITDANGNTISGAGGGGPNSIDPGLVAGVAIGAIIFVLILAILAWYCLVHKRKQSLSDRSVTIQNNMADDAAFKTPIQSPMQSPMQTPMQTPRGGGMMGVADEERGQLNQMKSFPDGLHNQPSMQSFAFQQPTMHTRTPTYSGQAASTVATIPQQPHYGLAQHQQPSAQPHYGLSQPQQGPNFYGPTQGMKPNF
jgi:hypothetical protein